MEKLITQNGGYKVYAKVAEVAGKSTVSALSFYTEWDDATTVCKQQKFIMFLNEQERKALKELL